MSQSDELSRAVRQLPLTEPVGSGAPATMIDEAMIRSLVDTFYSTIREDELLGPIFARHVADWSLHLPKMYAFWSTVVLRTGRYSGRPLEAHQRLPGLTQAHFARWISLWTQTVARVVPAPSREAFVVPATRMASSMSSVLLRGGASA
ncbi:MAG: group III truncated hemoglobin [Phycisphaerae bacterium]|nr:group III truncated hemoglobin [Phycisphaerae bacterium]